MIGAVLRCVAGYILASLAAGIVQVAFVLPPYELVGAGADRLSAAGIWLLLATLHSGIFGAPFALVALAVAEWRCFTGPVYYAAVGFSMAMLGFLAQISGHGFTQPVMVLLYVLVAFTLAGVSAGLVYWLVSGRRAGAHGPRLRQPKASVNAAPQ